MQLRDVRRWTFLCAFGAVIGWLPGCDSASPGGRDAAADRPRDGLISGSGGGGAGAGAGGSGGVSGTGGSSSGTGGAGAGGAGGGAAGTQPLGAVCANSGNCSQATGATVCCVNSCLPSDECPNNNFVACDPAPDYGCPTGRCCRATAGGQQIHYCTKSNGCAGTFVP